MTDDEVEVVARELAKAGGVTWCPDRAGDSLLKIVSDRYRDRARLAIAAVERCRAQASSAEASSAKSTTGHVAQPCSGALPDQPVRIGDTVVYRPPGERRAYPYRVEKIDAGRAYLVPIERVSTGWVSIDDLLPSGESMPSSTTERAQIR
jgi:hypothetical protein